MTEDHTRSKEAPASEQESAQDPPGKSKIEFTSEFHRDEILIYFESILDGLRKGKLQLKQSDRLIDLSPPESMEFEVKAAKKASKEKLSIKLSWRTVSPQREGH